MERRFDELAMPRYVDPGESRAGFVFTHAATGTKAFNVDVFDAGESHHFTFVLGVPGFRPDYADVDFDAIYDADELVRHDDKSIHEALMGLPCCSSNGEGDDRDGAINVVLIGAGTELRLALLRSNWEETSDAASADSTADFFFGRRQDAIFRYQSFVDDSSYELRLWLTPMLHGEDRVWAGQVRHFYRRVTSITRFDPDVDHARYFLMQNMLYGQAIARIGWVSGAEVVPVDSFWTNLFRPPFFTDGYRLVLWLSGDPISVSEAEAIDWDEPPGRADQ